MIKSLLAAAALALTAQTADADTTIPFDGSWREQGFLRLFSNDYIPRGRELGVVSDGTVSLYWRALPADLHGQTAASWNWGVSQGVPPTDLSQKGGDDRNLAMYFVFTSQQVADTANLNRAARLLQNEDTYALVYVWGGNHAKGTSMASPYHPRLRTIVLRGAGEGQHAERVNLAADYRAAFGTTPGPLIGLAVSGDSDDTGTKIDATVSNLTLR